MGKDKSMKQKKTSRKIQDLPMKEKRAAGVKGGVLTSGSGAGDSPPVDIFTLNRH
ncbi:MAG TPA: hypothetical protein VEU07_16365 [Candidatus Acidoferrum sp.]|nr:hypothetical protein [Candidatus Acidoferrum sp.]